MTMVGYSGFAQCKRNIVVAMATFMSLLMMSCGSLPTIGTDVEYCCYPSAENISSFRVEFEDTPEFLKPMLRDEASIVLSTKGLDYTEGDAHAILMMSFVNRTLESGDAAQNESWETIAPGGGVRFIAEVKMAMTDVVTGERIWAGTMARVHNVYEGSYMHDAPARAAMRNAFVTLFEDYPSTVDKED